MKLQQLKHRIARAEAVLEGREHKLAEQWATVGRVWRAAWTPGRIIVAGLGLGFIAGRSEPRMALGRITGKLGAAPQVLKMISAVSALFAVDLGAAAAEQAEAAAEPAAAPPPSAAPASPPPAPAASRGAGEPTPPHPAEAATEVSEH